MLRGGFVFIASRGQLDDARFGDGRDLTDFGDDRGTGTAIETNQRDGVGAAGGAAAAKSKGGDIEAEGAKGRSDGADDAGHVAIASEKNGAFEAGFNIDAIEARDARRAVGEDGAFGGDFSGIGCQSDFEGIGEATLRAADGFFDEDAAGSCGCRSIDQVHFLIEKAIENADEHRAAQNVRAKFGGFATEADAHAIGAAIDRLRDERAEALGEIEIRANAAVLLAGERGQIYRVANDSFLKIFADLLGDLNADLFLGLGGGTGDVRGGDDVGKANERRVRGRLVRKGVERGCSDFAFAQSFGECGFVDHFAAGAIDDAHAVLHLGEGVAVDQILCGRAERGVEGDVVGRFEKFGKSEELDVELAGDFGADVGIVGEDGHLKSLGAAGDFGANAAEPDEAERFSANFSALSAGFFPAAGVNGGVALRDRTGDREEEGEGVFGDGGGVAAGGIRDQDAAAGGDLDVDVVDANTGAADDAKLIRFFEKLRGNFGGGADDEAGGVSQFGGERGGIGGDDLPARRAQDFEATRANFIRDDYFHGVRFME